MDGTDVRLSFCLNAVMGGFSSRADGSLSLRFVTSELTSNEIQQVAQNVNTFGVLSFVDKGLTNEPPLLTVDKELNEKTPSQRLRGAIWVLCEKTLKHKPTTSEFNDFYRDYMEKILTVVKSKIEDII